MRKLLALILFSSSSALGQVTFQTKPLFSPWSSADVSSMSLRLKGRLTTDPVGTYKDLRTIALVGWETSLNLDVTTVVPSTASWEIRGVSAYVTPVAATGTAPFELGTQQFPVPQQALAGQTIRVTYNPATGLGAVSPVGSPPPPPSEIASSIANGATISGSILWTVTVPPTPSFVNFYIDNVLRWTEGISPYQFNGDPNGRLQTGTLTNGAHTLRVVATYSSGPPKELILNVTVAN